MEEYNYLYYTGYFKIQRFCLQNTKEMKSADTYSNQIMTETLLQEMKPGNR